MKEFVFLQYGFETPTQEIMDAWNAWFTSIGDRIVHLGTPFGPGREISREGVKELPMDKEAATGYSIISAESMEEAVEIAQSCPFITSVRVYEAVRR